MLNITTTDSNITLEYLGSKYIVPKNNILVENSGRVYTFILTYPFSNKMNTPIFTTTIDEGITLNGANVTEGTDLSALFRNASGGGGIEVIDSLDSTSTTDALSANQGRILNGKASLANEKAGLANDAAQRAEAAAAAVTKNWINNW